MINQNPFVIYANLDMNTHICRYMDFDKFLNILNKRFYIPQKGQFWDNFEKGILPLNRTMVPHAMPSPDDTQEMINTACAHEDRMREKIKKQKCSIEESKILPTSCWQQDIREDYLMWKSYTFRVGVRIKTTINAFLSSLDYSSKCLIPVLAPIKYDGIKMNKTLEDNLFSKEETFRSEQEIRFYFLPHNAIPVSDIEAPLQKYVCKLFESTINNDGDNTNELGGYYHLHNLDFIREIKLSPFINHMAQKQIKELLVEKFNIDKKIIKESKINNLLN